MLPGGLKRRRGQVAGELFQSVQGLLVSHPFYDHWVEGCGGGCSEQQSLLLFPPPSHPWPSLPCGLHVLSSRPKKSELPPLDKQGRGRDKELQGCRGNMDFFFLSALIFICCNSKKRKNRVAESLFHFMEVPFTLPH